MALDGERIETIRIIEICKPKEGVRSSVFVREKPSAFYPLASSYEHARAF